MKYGFTFGVILIPELIWAHDGSEAARVWYQIPELYMIGLTAVVALLIIIYAVRRRHLNSQMIVSLLMVIAVGAGLTYASTKTPVYESQVVRADFGAGHTVTLYKSPNCGCCSGHAAALTDAGFSVMIEETDDMEAVKEAYGIAGEGQSCHTSVIGEYVVEGHVPLEAIEKLLTEKPDIAGIGLSGMPIGTPGMPGKKTVPFEVYQLAPNGDMSPYITL